MKKRFDPLSVECGYCGAEAGKACVSVLAPEVEAVTVAWSHRTREEAANV